MENDKSGDSSVELSKVIESRFLSSNVKKGIIITFSALLAIYLGISLYFMNHFPLGTKINGVNISGKTVEQANELLRFETESYVLKLKERGDKEEQISAADIGLKYDSGNQIQDLKNNQNPFGWILGAFKKQNTELAGIISLDDNMLNKVLDKLDCLTSKNIVEPVSAKLNYTENGYEIVSEVAGNKINRDSLYIEVKNAILNDELEIDLDSANCYEKPKFTSDSQEILDAKNTANKYLASKITYTFGDQTEVLDKAKIHNWLSVNENCEVIFAQSKVKDYVNSLDNKYGTAGKARSFKTQSGATIKVGAYVDMSGENKANPDYFYGWSISTSKETKDLIENIKNGQSVTKEPKYAKEAKSHGTNDIGNTYVEVSLTAQHMWFYKNGSIIVESNVVTGSVKDNVETPPGVYAIYAKESPSTLKGKGVDGKPYEQPVDYWMPFNSGVGLHDATRWRPTLANYGGDIYKTNGSHGCVNLPVNVAATLYANIEVGTPVVVY